MWKNYILFYATNQFKATISSKKIQSVHTLASQSMDEISFVDDWTEPFLDYLNHYGNMNEKTA